MTRLEYFLVQQALTVLGEAKSTQYHTQRFNYAQIVLQSPSNAAQDASTMIAGSTNIVAATSYDLPSDSSTCTATDGAFLSQISAWWNNLASIEQGT